MLPSVEATGPVTSSDPQNAAGWQLQHGRLSAGYGSDVVEVSQTATVVRHGR